MNMVKLYDGGVYLVNGTEIVPEAAAPETYQKDTAKQGTIAYSILKAHNTAEDMQNLRLKFDALASHDITFVGIIQTARASGMEKFPIPYVLTNCHNSLCAVGGTINEDDHVFGLSAARKYGGIYVPPHMAVIHQYMREAMAGCGKMILGSDSHTRYGALGTMAIGEGGGELVKQLLENTYDVAYPGVVAVYLTGKELKAAMEVDASVTPIMPAAQLYMSGAKYAFNTKRMFFNRIYDTALTDVTFHETGMGNAYEIDDNALYRVVTGMYSAQMLGTVKSKSMGLLSL